MTDSGSSRVTIYDVAAEAGVAISTVSRVLNNSSEVSDATRTRVQDAIRKLRFEPQRTARSLAQQSTTSLAVALPSATSLFYVELLKGVKDALRERDIDLLLCNLGSRDPAERLQRFLNRGAVGGLLLVSLSVDERLRERLMGLQAPVVLIGARADGFDSFWWDDPTGARRATEHLIQLGHRRIGFIAAQTWSESTAPRRAGYEAALADAGIEASPELIATGRVEKHAGYSEEAGAEAMQQLMALDDPPTAVFASADVQAYGAWSYARDNGIRIPRDVSLIGYDDLKLSRYLDLSTVNQHALDTGFRATRRLLDRMSAPSSERADVEIPLDLVERGSTAAR